MNNEYGFLEGLPEIAKAVNRSPSTIRRWIFQFAFPAAKSPKGTWISSVRLIDSWITARARLQLDSLNAQKSPETGS